MAHYDYRVWCWIPQSGMIEHIEWLTNVIESQNCNEQRIRLRQAPRQFFEATVLITNLVQLSRLRVLLAARQSKVWGWPCWHEAIPLGEELLQSSVAIDFLDFSTSDYRTHGLAFLYVSPTHYEVVEYNMEEGVMYLVDQTGQDFPADATIMPMRMARMAARADRNDFAVSVSKLSITVEVIDSVMLDDPYLEQLPDYDLQAGGGSNGY